MKKLQIRTYGFVVLFSMVLLVFTIGSMQAQEVINDNGDFSADTVGQTSGLTNWQLLGGDYAEFEVVADPDDALNNLLQVTITDIDGVDDPWDIQVRHYADPQLELTEGTNYQISLRIRVENPDTAVVSLDAGGDESLWGQALAGEEWHLLETVEFTAGEDESRIFAIHFGSPENQNGQVFYLDYLAVAELDTDDNGDDLLLVESFDDHTVIGNWDNGGGSTTLDTSDDRVEGTGSLDWTYEVMSGEEWGGSSDIQVDTVLDLSGTDGLSLYFKVIDPADPAGVASFVMKIFIDDGDGGNDEWHYTVPGVLEDDSDDWVQVKIPYGSFAIPSWMNPTGEEVLALDMINDIQMQVIIGGDAATTSGRILLDYLAAYIDDVDPDPDPVAFAVSMWGFNPGTGGAAGWALEAGDPGDVTVSGDATPTQWMALRGGFDQVVTLEAPGQYLSVTGTLEMIGGGLPLEGGADYPALRYGLYQDNANAGMLIGDTWTGIDGGNYGYLFNASSGTGGAPTWLGSNTPGTFGAIVNRTWYSTNGPNDYVLGDTLHQPANAEALAGIYEFEITVTAVEGGQEVSFILMKDDTSYTFAGWALDPDTVVTNSFSSVNFAFSAAASATGLAFSDVTVTTTGALSDPPLPIPQPPHAVGDIINFNGSFELQDLGDVESQDDVIAWSINMTAASEFEIVDDAQDDDSRAMRVDFGEWDGSNNDWHVEMVNEPFFPLQGDMMRASVWLKADTDTRVANLYLGLPESGGWARKSSQQVTLSTEWREYYFNGYVADAADEANNMRFAIAMNFEANHEGVIYVDNVQVRIIDEIVSVDPELPIVYALEQNYPNPFNPTTQIQFSLPERADVVLEVFDILGRRVATLINNESYDTGIHTITWNATNRMGYSVSSGVYIYRLQAGDFVQTKRMMFLK